MEPENIPDQNSPALPGTNPAPAPAQTPASTDASAPAPVPAPADPLAEALAAGAPAADIPEVSEQARGAEAPTQNIDLDSILLPQKDIHTPASAQRVNAAVLLEQEQHATLAPDPAQTQPEPVAPAALETAPEPEDKKETPFVKPLETFQGDIAQYVTTRNVSTVSIAAAEAERRGKNTGAAPPRKSMAGRVLLILFGLALLAAAGGAVAFVLLRPTSVPIQQAAAAPFISVDGTQTVQLAAGETHSAAMASLQTALAQVNLPLGLVARLYPVFPATSTEAAQEPVDTQTFLTTLAPDVPQNLLRTLSPTFLLGVHSFGTNQPFLILKTDSYEQAYAGMLAWEQNMHQDLLPLFSYTPIQHIPEEHLATSTTATSTATSTEAGPLQTGFVDREIENHDARALVNGTDDVLFLWTFLDRSTIIITTNQYALREVITRLKNAPIVPLPEQ